jgi:hypothetical protein
MRVLLPIVLLTTTLLQSAEAQGAGRYPVTPVSLPDADEIVLAMSAAPEEVSSRADIYALRGTTFEKIRTGTNGTACMVARDYHPGSLYPICFDQEGVRTLMQREMREVSLRAQGVPESRIDSMVQHELASGKLPRARKPALAYMMSPLQVLYSSADSTGRRVGRWFPHVMMANVGISKEQLGLSSRYLYLQAGGETGSLHEFVVLTAVWSDGKPASSKD